MKAGTQNHVKTKRLQRLLKRPLYQVVGVLESLWLLCADCADEGDFGKFSDDEIASYMEWDGRPGDLIAALAEAGWTDQNDHGRPVVHDWLEHCPEYIKERIRKRRARATKEGAARCQLPTYDLPEPDNTGPTPDKPGFVPSIPNPTNPNQSQPIPTKPGAANAADPSPPQTESPSSTRRKRPASEPAAPPPLPPVLAADPFPAAWLDWLAYRTERRLSTRDRTMRAQLESLAPLGPVAAAECLRVSIRNGWQGIFPEKGKHNGKHHGPTARVGPGQRYRDPSS